MENASLNSWFIDSGASNHICTSKNLFENITSVDGEDVVVADGRSCKIEGIGNLKLLCNAESNGKHQFNLKEVSFVPELDSNILSVDKLNEDNYKVSFTKKTCEISRDGLKLISILSRNGLYEIHPVQVQQINFVSESKTQSDCIHLWQRRLGHRDFEIVKQMETDKIADGFHIKSCNCIQDIKCEICLGGKMCKKKFPKKSLTTSSSILELVHSDLMGPIEVATPSGKKYMF